jgi:hypothetical protein
MKGDALRTPLKVPRVTDPHEGWIRWIKVLAPAAVITGGIFGGLGLIDLLAPVAVLAVGFGLDDLWAAWKEAEVGAEEQEAPKRPRYWFLVALGYTVAAATAVAVAWWYVS